MVGTATAARHLVVNLEHLERKLHLAAVALPFLLAEQYVPILPVVDWRLDVGATASAPLTIPELLRLWRGQTKRPYQPPAR